MLTRCVPRFLLLAAVLLSIAWPAHAELRWNPFDHMTDADATWFLILLPIVLLVSFAGVPAFISFIVYRFLKRRYPHVSTTYKIVLLYALIGQLIAGQASKFFPHYAEPGFLHTFFGLLGVAGSLGLTVGAAAYGFFKHTKPA